MSKVEVTTNSYSLSLTAPIPTLKYLNNFIRLNKSATDMLKTGVFPDAKEITESFAAHNALVRGIVNFNLLKKINPLIIVAGDGCTPRTGVTLAFKTPFNIVSLDPNNRWINKKYGEDGHVERLDVYTNTLKQFVDDWEFVLYDRLPNCPPIILIGVHPHIPKEELRYFKKVVGKRLFAVIEISCCHPTPFIKTFGEPTKKYVDWGIHSTKRDVRIWKFSERDYI